MREADLRLLKRLLAKAVVIDCRDKATGEIVPVLWNGCPLVILYSDVEQRVVPPRSDGTWVDEPPRRCGAPFLEE